jgi:hypothetical protein
MFYATLAAQRVVLRLHQFLPRDAIGSAIRLFFVRIVSGSHHELPRWRRCCVMLLDDVGQLMRKQPESRARRR